MNDLKSRGLMFKAPLVMAILNGEKTQTRRMVKLPIKREAFVMLDYGNGWWPFQSDDGESELCDDGCEHPYSSPFGEKGELLYVRETFALKGNSDGCPSILYKADNKEYYFDGEKVLDVKGETEFTGAWKPAIHMNKKYARIWLEVDFIRVEKLQDISDEDAMKEGITLKSGQSPRQAFFDLWNTTGADYKDNPWVWVVGFKKVEKN